jgi:hypothetical protein
MAEQVRGRQGKGSEGRGPESLTDWGREAVPGWKYGNRNRNPLLGHEVGPSIIGSMDSHG